MTRGWPDTDRNRADLTEAILSGRCVMKHDSTECAVHDEPCDWVECTGWQCPESGQIIKAYLLPDDRTSAEQT